MKKLLILMMLFLWGIVTSSKQNKYIEPVIKAPIIQSLDSLNNSLEKLNKVLDERN